MMLMLNLYEKNLINDHHLQYVHEDQNQLNELVNIVLMDVPLFKKLINQIKNLNVLFTCIRFFSRNLT